MPRVLCPHCHTQLTIDEQWRGRVINCIDCGRQLAIAASAPGSAAPPSDRATPPNNRATRPSGTTAPLGEPATQTRATADQASVVISPRPSGSNSRRKRPVGNRLISAAMHLSISAATIYLGYYLISQRAQRKATRPQAASHQATAPSAIAPTEPPVASAQPRQPDRTATRQPPPRVASDADSPTNRVRVDEPSADSEIVAAEPSANRATASRVRLPAIDSPATATLASDLDPGTPAEAAIQFYSSAPALSYAAGRIRWGEAGHAAQDIAELEMAGGELQFRWAIPSRDEPDLDELDLSELDGAVRNSVVLVDLGQRQRAIRLRHPTPASRAVIDLSRSRQTILGKCDYLPAAEDVYFELLGIDALPAHTAEGDDPARLPSAGEMVLRYVEAPAETRITLTKRGRVAALEFETRYFLPSGSEQPMSIGSGNKNLKALESLTQEIAAAQVALPGLRTYLSDLEREGRGVSGLRATATAKAVRLQQLQQEAASTRQRIRYAESLATQRASAEADFAAIQQVAKLAQQLHKTELSYRFFTVVEGYEVDLLLAP